MTTVVWVVVVTIGRGLRHMLYKQQQGQTQQVMKMMEIITKATIAKTVGITGTGLLTKAAAQCLCLSSESCRNVSAQQYLL